MIRSMTGFGQANRSSHGFRMQIDIKSVNHRYSEIQVRMPREWATLEDPLKKTIQQQLKRGRVDVFVQLEPETAGGKSVEVDWALVEGYRQAAEQIGERLALTDKLSLKELLSLPDVIRFKEQTHVPLEIMERELIACASDALEQLILMRQKEGEHLRNDLEERLHTLQTIHGTLRRYAPQVAEDYRIKLKQRMEELLEGSAILDDHRLAMEAAVFADRSNIDEELTRLESHFDQFRQMLSADEPIGRKLDFLLQEMNREINTIGSKANHGIMAGQVVEMKAELEKIREQAQNIE
jgi:uncharacterized protein (TIGR00255 family)